MNHPSLLTLDTLDDRRELHTLLARLSPRARVSFLAWCCGQVTGRVRPVASARMGSTVGAAYRCGRADDRLTNEVYGDLLSLAANYGFDLAAAAAELERRVRGRPASAPAASS
ncbi:unnamed protein product [Gemmataceae bacterium]|nr:unnamed protein product [Gemmataceae bacterium]VTT96582.1 unnamed protein product [Gemmataceae bacterium]